MPASLVRLLLLALLSASSFNLLAAPDTEQSAKVVHLLGYLSADYPATVANGQVIEATEYREQVEFVGVLQKLLPQLPQHPERAALEQGVTQLRQAIEQRAEGAQVATLARHLAEQVAQLYQLNQLPTITPNPEHGKALYAEHCSVCHGVNGVGDGPAAGDLARVKAKTGLGVKTVSSKPGVLPRM